MKRGQGAARVAVQTVVDALAAHGVEIEPDGLRMKPTSEMEILIAEIWKIIDAPDITCPGMPSPKEKPESPGRRQRA